jgi:hypothetical protein
MKKLLLATSALLAICTASQAAVIANLGVNPTSASGAFSNSVAGTTFDDQYTFQLVGGPQFFTIASATNVFPQTTDFITNFSGSVFLQVGAIGGGDDLLVLGPASPNPCPFTPSCQGFAGSAVLAAGNYYLDISGTGGGTSGYGGNIATAPVAVPGPTAGSFTLGSILAMLK